jgi:glucosamine--fructose-6-phosphate aminotransferase (isomerizing)
MTTLDGQGGNGRDPGSWSRQAFAETEEAMLTTLETTVTQLAELAARLKDDGCSEIIVTGEGCSYTAATMCEMAFERWSDLACRVSLTSELSFVAGSTSRDTCVVVLSRTGERRFILEAVGELRESCGRVVAVTGNPDAKISQLADETILTREGPEPAFLKSKSTLCGIAALLGLASALGEPGLEPARQAALFGLARSVGEAFTTVRSLSDVFQTGASRPEHWAVAAGGPSHGAAADGALKLHEITTVHASSYHLSALYHGALGQLSPEWGGIVLSTEWTRDWADVLAAQLLERGVEPVIFLDATVSGSAPEGVSHIRVPVAPLSGIGVEGETLEMLSPPLFLPSLYALILESALARGIDPDAPPNMDYMLDLILPQGQQEPDLVWNL